MPDDGWSDYPGDAVLTAATAPMIVTTLLHPEQIARVAQSHAPYERRASSRPGEGRLRKKIACRQSDVRDTPIGLRFEATECSGDHSPAFHDNSQAAS